jgi:hypothetical protein
MDGYPRRAGIEGLVAHLLRYTLNSEPYSCYSAIKASDVNNVFLSSSAFNPSIDNDSTPSTLDIISAIRTPVSMSDSRFTNESGDNPEVVT